MIGKPERFGVADAECSSASRTRCGHAVKVGAKLVALLPLTARPASDVASEATGDGPE